MPGVIWAEDQEEDRYLIQTAANDLGFDRLRFVTNGVELLAALEGPRPDRVVLDLGMPQLSGLDALRQLRAAPKHNNLPVSVFTGLQDPALELACTRLGADPFVHKPLAWRDFSSTVSKLLAPVKG